MSRADRKTQGRAKPMDGAKSLGRANTLDRAKSMDRANTLDRLEIPVIQGGMGIGISLGGLAGAVAAEGGMGVISTANIGFREPDFWENTDEADARALRREIRKAKEIAGGRGLIAINAMVATTRYANMVRIACEEGIDAVISGAGLPLELPEITREYDVMIAPIVSGGRAAKTLLRMWKKRHDRLPDFIVVEGSQAGGHLGFSQEELESGTAQDLPIIVADVVREAAEAASWGGRRATGYGEAAESARFAAGEIPRSADALSSRAAAPSSAGETARSADALVSGPAAPAVADERGRLNEDGDHAAPAIPVFAAGSVFDGKDMAACKAAGARGVQIATRFIACRECDATQAFKDVILAARAEDVMILKSPVGMPGRGLATPLMQRVARGDGLPPKRCIRCIRTCDPATTPYCINRALIGAFYGNLEEGLFFCGGNVDRVTEMTTVHELMEELAREWRNR